MCSLRLAVLPVVCPCHSRPSRAAFGFTLLEIMIVVGIIALLAVIAIPSFMRARETTRVTAFVNDLQKATDAFEMYAMERGNYPPDANRGVIPPGMESFLPKMNWTNTTPLGGRWDWERNTLGIRAGVSAVTPTAPPSAFQEVDLRIDDGNLASGRFQFINSDRYTYIVLP